MIVKNCNMRTFFERCGNKKIVCYGIGYDFERILKNHGEYPWTEKVRLLVDNDPKKKDTDFRIGEQKYEITDLEGLLREDLSTIVILISCSYYAEILQQLNAISRLDQTECYIYYFMFTLSEHNPVRIRQREKCLIPKVIHYCWFGGGRLPDLYTRCIESWHKYCSEYEIVEWNESNCNVNENAFVRQAYERKKYGFVPDYFRLKIIYEQGGIYLDTDVELLRSLNDLRYNEAFCGMEVPGEAAFGLGFGAVAGHPVVAKLLERYRYMQFSETISPIWQTTDLMDMGMQYGNRQQEIHGMTIYPIEVLSPMNLVTGELELTEYTYAIHHYDGSWVSGERLEMKKKRQENIRKIQALMQREKGRMTYAKTIQGSDTGWRHGDEDAGIDKG